MNDSDDKKQHKGRRRLLKGIAAGSGAVLAGKTIPQEWSRPVVDSVMLPVHAQASLRVFTSNGQITGMVSDTTEKYAGLLDGLVNTANAQPPELEELQEPRVMNGPMFTDEGGCIVENPDGTVQVDCLLGDGYTLATLNAPSVTVGGSPSMMSGQPCMMADSLLDKSGLIPKAHAGGFFGDVEVQIDSVEGSAVGRYIIFGGKFTIPINYPLGVCQPPSCPPPEPPE